VTPLSYGTLNPFLLVDDAAAYLDFLVAVFDGHENLAARTTHHDGLLIHAEVRIGTSTVMLADRKPAWTPRPGLLQVYVDALSPVLSAAVERGATVVTEPTDFYGNQRLARFEDPWGTLWWLFEYGEDSTAPAEMPDELPTWTVPPGPSYVFDSLDEVLRR
jgi:PhnB protein